MRLIDIGSTRSRGGHPGDTYSAPLRAVQRAPASHSIWMAFAALLLAEAVILAAVSLWLIGP